MKAKGILRKYSLYVISLFSCCLLQSINHQPKEVILYWNADHRLIFADFQGIPDKQTPSTSGKKINITHLLGTINKGIEVHLITERSRTIFSIYAGMKKDSSWIRNPNDTITLKHEQGHFDICELYARMLRRDMKKARSISDTREVYRRVLDQEDAEQDAYDRENSFDLGGIRPSWKDSIANRIQLLNRYASPVVVLPFSK